MLLTDAQDLIEIMNWEDKAKKNVSPGQTRKKGQRELFIELTNEEKIVVGILAEKESVAIDEINIKSGLSSSTVAAAILNLELQNVVLSLPGKLYQLA